MVYRRRAAKRRTYKPRRVTHKPRIRRPFKVKGFFGLRFFKLRQSQRVSQAPSTAGGYFITNDPSTAEDWNNVTNLFDSYRVAAIRLRFVPDGTMQSMTDANATAQYFNVPVYIIHDCNSIISTAPTLNTLFNVRTCGSSS